VSSFLLGVLSCTNIFLDLWNGVKKQSVDELQKSLHILQWERTDQPDRHKGDLDEVAIHALLRACVLRNMRKFDEARAILKTDILSHEK
jgi:hypothetical protein